MHFPSSSWGKFGASKEFSNIMKKVDPDNSFHLHQELFDELCKDLKTIETQKETITKTLEEWKMPVYNPKTGEQDTVDLSLVNNIAVDAQYLKNMKDNKVVKISISLSGDENNSLVYLKADSKELESFRSQIAISHQDFEEILYYTINDVKSQKLEDEERFRSNMSNLINQVISAAWNDEQYYCLMNVSHEKEMGVGIIRDTKTDQEIGTFECLTYSYAQKTHEALIENIILSGRTMNDLIEPGRFEFLFYSLEDNVFYSLISNNENSKITSKDGIQLKDFKLIMDSFNEKHTKFDMTVSANKDKSLIKAMDQNSPIYDSNYQEFREKRLILLEESKTKQKHEKLVNQFSDIQLF